LRTSRFGSAPVGIRRHRLRQRRCNARPARRLRPPETSALRHQQGAALGRRPL